MTEEEKIICKQFLNDADETHSCNEYKLLMTLIEQEPKTDILDKIRAEIIQVVAEENPEDSSWAAGLKYSLKIIDKYMAESEPQESKE